MTKPLTYEKMHMVDRRIANAGAVNTRQHESQLTRADFYYIRKNPDDLSVKQLAQMYSLDKDVIAKIRASEAPVNYQP